MEKPKSLSGTKTEKNIALAYVSESCAYTRYTFFAKAAQKESYFGYAEIFNETAENELAHAKVFLKLLAEGDCETPCPVSVDAGVIGKTADNLKVAASQEELEGVKQYMNSAKVAEEEGFTEIAEVFRAIASIENHHRERYDKMRSRILDGTVWKSGKPVEWQCMVCGYITEGTVPPEKCPSCAHPQPHFKRAVNEI